MASNTKNVGGRPPKYTDPEELAAKINEYFESCDGELLRDPETDEPILDKYQHPIYVNRRPPPSAGLARALGFRSRTSLFDYKGKKKFKDVIEDAILRLEERTEERLYDRDGANGAKFSLQNNFRWRDSNKEDNNAPAVNIICDIPRTAAPKPEPVTPDKEPNAED